MKKLFAMLTCLAMMLSLAACGSGSSNVTTTGGSSTAPETTSEKPEADKGTSDSGLIPVTIQLKWVQQAQFMGYYAAKELGIYEDYGLDVTIVPGGSTDVIDEVDSGRADFGVTWVSTAISAIANGANVISVAQYYQDSGMTLLSLKDTVKDPAAVNDGEVTATGAAATNMRCRLTCPAVTCPPTT